MSQPTPLWPAQLARRLVMPDGVWPQRLWALLDVREAGEYGTGHIPGATSLPRRMLEFRIGDLVPRRDVSVVVYDAGSVGDGPDRRAALAAAMLAEHGWTRVSVLSGGIAAWRAEGHSLAEGANVPCKTFGERVLHEEDVPQIEADALAVRLKSGERLAVCDVRSPAEYVGAHLPGAYGTPSFDLALHLLDLQQAYDGIVVNCAGRTRSIIGTVTLKLLGTDRLWALKNGTMGWQLAGHALERDATRMLAAPSSTSFATITKRAEALALSVGVRQAATDEVAALIADCGRSGAYLLDVRRLEDFTAGHISGAIFLAGGQAVQHADDFLAVPAAPVLLVDEGDARAWLTAYWYRRMGFADVRVLEGGMPAWRAAGRPCESGRGRHPPLGTERAEKQVPLVSAPVLRAALDSAAKPLVVDVGTSRDFAAGHVPGARWIPRGWLEARIGCHLAMSGDCVVASRSPEQSMLAAAALHECGYEKVGVLGGGVDAWRSAGFELARGLPAGEAADDLIDPPYQKGLDSMRRYLDWEVRLHAASGGRGEMTAP